MTEVTKLRLKTKKLSINKQNEIVDAFINACVRMDPSIFEPLMHEDQLFEDKTKWVFMTDLRNKLWSKSLENSNKLSVRTGQCEGCSCGQETLEFYDEKGKFHFAYLIEKEKGEVKDIFECFMSSGWEI